MHFELSFTIFLGLITKVNAHGHVISPRSRNYVASKDGKWSGGTAKDPKIETCPHCLNRGGICGKNNEHDYNTPLNTFGDPMPVNIQGNFQQGGVYTFDAVLTAHHKGHFEYKACSIQPGEIPTQDCFDQHKLEFVEDVFYGAPKDSNFPERAYIPNSSYSTQKDASGYYLYRHKYRLPSNLVGDLVLIQWHYVTANSCLPEGYNQYTFPTGFEPGNLSTCGPLPPDGNGVPEQFWNCVEVKVASSTPTSPVANPTPVVSPTNAPVTSPINPPVSNPTNPPVSGPVKAGSDSRLIAFLGNWQSCPTLEQTAKYTHIVIAFAVTYTWDPNKNICSQSCTIGAPVPICNNQNNQALVNSWKAQGKKVILSFGGAGMGGSWAGDNNDCWDYCYGKEQSVINQLDTIVRAQNFDGVDIDYEYFYNTVEAQNFLKVVTTGLKSTLPAGSIVSHAPMDTDLLPQSNYYKLLKDVSSSLDFIMPQYYNGFTRPAIDGIDGTGAGSVSALSHYDTLVNDMFNGDATKIIFGFCISDCSGTGSNANAVQAATVMSDLRQHYSCNGGAFFWVAAHDTNGSWSQIVSNKIAPYAGCSNSSPTISPKPTFPQTPAPTPSPVAPTSSPTSSPVTPGKCPAGFSGLIATSDCKGYYHCQNGSLITNTPTMCQTGLLFNQALQVCDWNYNVICPSSPTAAPLVPPTVAPVVSPTVTPVVPPTIPPVAPTSSPTSSPVTTGKCPAGFSGLIATGDCKGYYHCQNGSLITNTPTMCQTGLLFNQALQVCDWNYNVICPSTFFPTNKPTQKPTFFPTNQPTQKPTFFPTNKPTFFPTNKPTQKPTFFPTNKPTQKPTFFPTNKNLNSSQQANPTKTPTLRGIQ